MLTSGGDLQFIPCVLRRFAQNVAFHQCVLAPSLPGFFSLHLPLIVYVYLWNNAAEDYVVAIDLGTARTAYSWKSAMDPDPSVGVPDMQPNEDIVGKSPTTLLVGGSTGADEIFTPSGVEAYGRVAQDLYANNDIPHGSQLFKHFKMVRRSVGRTYQVHNKRPTYFASNRFCSVSYLLECECAESRLMCRMNCVSCMFLKVIR